MTMWVHVKAAIFWNPFHAILPKPGRAACFGWPAQNSFDHLCPGYLAVSALGLLQLSH
jgi:hypothetical protein